MANERRISTWDVLRGVLSVGAMLLAGLASLSARLLVERSDAADTQLERRIALLEAQISPGILPRSDERIMQLRQDVERLRQDFNQHLRQVGE